MPGMSQINSELKSCENSPKALGSREGRIFLHVI